MILSLDQKSLCEFSKIIYEEVEMKSIIQILFFFLLLAQICFGQWYQQNSGTTKNLSAVHFIDANNGWTVGDSGTIIHTTNAGTTWLQQTTGTTIHLKDVQFIDSNIGWAVGDNNSHPVEYVIIKTTNGGTSWIQLISDTSIFCNALYFVDANTGWVVGGKVVWDTINNTGYISPIIMKTTNGGTNWSFQIIPNVNVPLNDIYFLDDNIGFAVGGYVIIGWGGIGGLLKTTDGGDSWIEQSLNWTSLYGIAFSDTENGIIATASALIYRTTDGGINWDSDTLGDWHIFSVTSSDLMHTWGVGRDYSYQGIIQFSSDQGVTWTSQYTFSGWPNSLFFIDSTMGWVAGEGGIILHTTNGGVTFVDDETTQPTDFILSQNFPNPFNPSTTIKFAVPQTSQVLIKVFDVLGNEIETLVNQEKHSGTYEITWNAVNLPSGVYFYRLQAGSFVQTRKMILLR